MKKILVVDYGSQYNLLVSRRIREEGVYSEICSFDHVSDALKSGDVIGIVLTGGPHSVYSKDAFELPDEILSANLPVLGICYGFQLMAQCLGGEVQKATKSEFGKVDLTVAPSKSCLFKGLPEKFEVFMSHGDSIKRLPEGFEPLGFTSDCPIAAGQDVKRKLYGVQFHPEVNDTQYGQLIIRNFLFDIVHAERNWSLGDFINDKVNEINMRVGVNERVLLGLSGGVDSAVSAALIAKAVEKRLTCLFIDHGLLRKNEAQEVISAFEHENLDFRYVDASYLFLNALKGITDPEEKRKIIGSLFIETFHNEAKKIGNFDYLAQGTIYPDVVESGAGGNSVKIKSHHNVGGLPSDIGFKGLIEPLNFLFKDEVRKVGMSLGLPESIVYRQPFPGPGLAIRIIGEVTREKVEIVQNADFILREEIKNSGLEHDINQYFVALTNMKTVGVEGDGRSYEYAAVVRTVKTVDFMTAKPFDLSYSLITRVADRIVNEVKGINRVLFDFTSKPPATIELE